MAATSNSDFWSDRGPFKYPNFLPNSMSDLTRQIQWEVFGIVAALHLFTIGAGPEPMCPFFLIVAMLTAAYGDGDVDPTQSISLPLLRLLDKDSADTLAVWLCFPADAPLPTSLAEPLCQFIINVGEKQV